MARDLDDVIRQMAAHGIQLPARVDLNAAFRNYLRFRPEGAKSPKKSAWVRLYEFKAQSGRVYITGAYGNRGDTFTIEASDTAWTPAERAAWLEHRKEAEKAAAAERQAEGEKAATKAARMWKSGRDFGPQTPPHPYLERKRVGAFGVRLGFNQRLLVPLRDVVGQLHGVQYISPEGDKIFGTGTLKEGRGHLIGELREGVPFLAFGEGYATCASVHMATGWPVVVCFDAGNLAAVMADYRKLYPELPMVVAADDDRHLHVRLVERLKNRGIICTVEDLRESMDREWRVPDGPHVVLQAGWKADAVGVMRIEGTITVNGTAERLLLENAGQAKAHAAAKRFKARVVTPFFVDRSCPHTDWNDLHCAAGLDAVREQLTTAIDAPPENPGANARAPRGKGKGGGNDDGQWRDREGDMPFMERFTLIYGTTTVWDAQQREIIKLEAMKAAFGKRVDWWLGQTARQIVPSKNVVFDPTGKCRAPDYVNLFDRLPLEPVRAPDRCARIVEHLWNLCQENDALCHWVTAWLAYPLQNPGAKMRTAILMHGKTEGTGKSKLGEIMRAIYGRYCTSVGQAELQRDFNDWMSARLFILAEEVVARQELSHLQGALQALVTQPTVQINTKNMPIREEGNHANFIFFSNQQVPIKLNPRDRRYTVIKVEQERPPEYFKAIDDELANGGAQAFYQYLLDYDLKGFNEHTRPFENRERVHLITLGMSPDQRFIEYWRSGYAGVPFCCCVASELYTAFKAWCRVNGERFVPTSTAFGNTVRDEMERMGQPPKMSKRYYAYSEKAVIDGDWDEANMSHRQNILYFVNPESELLRPRAVGDDPPKLPDPLPAATDAAFFNSRIKLFQAQLHELLASARRAV